MNKKSFTSKRRSASGSGSSRTNSSSVSRRAKRTKKRGGSKPQGSGGFSRASGRKSFRGGSRGGNNNRRKQPSYNINSFINKATFVEEAPFVPKHSFADFAVDISIKKNLERKGYTKPTAIQDEVIPCILEGKDVVGLANTGTGKTAAFLIPLIHGVYANKAGQILVLTPTRELALQIEEEFRTFSRGMNLASVVCVGGTPITPQIRKLKNYNHIVIGTPGRVIDLIKRGKLKLGGVQSVVLDEADRMLDMGFVNDMRFILESVPKKRHTLCFSATMPREIEAIVSDFLNDPVKVSVKTQDTSKNIDQDVVRINGRDKIDILVEHLIQKDFSRVMVFGRTKHGVEKLSKSLNRQNIKTESIHGNKSHGQRQRALKRFKDGEVTALIATDVAARGLDINNVTHVINYDLPESYDDYVHRIGRTGRGEKSGKALTFVG
ncbi:MAG: DEAD/DEAH box helicase [Candidatus Pacebacteria bacterium]|nr:DEAD/DEAH box helicase [Candidatus Paceibacterota bacterium]